MKGKFYEILNELNMIGQKKPTEEGDLKLQKLQPFIIESYKEDKLSHVEYKTLYRISGIMLHDARVLLRQ